MSSKIHIALASDENYFRGLLTTVFSIIQYCTVPNRLVFHVLDGGISDANWRLLSKTCTSKGADLVHLSVDQTVFSSLDSWHGSGKMTYARLLLPEMMPAIDTVIYSDVDILWRTDIRMLWELRDSAISLHYVKEPSPNSGFFRHEIDWLEHHNLSFDRGKYFCAGMLMINLERFRKYRFHEQALRMLVETGGDAPIVDQTALNCIFANRGDIAELPKLWQTMSSDRQALSTRTNAVIHYAGDCPWKPLLKTNHLLSDLLLLWHRTYCEIVGISVWKSLRADNSAPMIVFGRALYLMICHSWLFKKIITFYLRARNKDPEFLETVFRVRE